MTTPAAPVTSAAPITRDQIIAAAACLDDLSSGTLSLADTLREQAAAKEHVALLYRLVDTMADTTK